MPLSLGIKKTYLPQRASIKCLRWVLNLPDCDPVFYINYVEQEYMTKDDWLRNDTQFIYTIPGKNKICSMSSQEETDSIKPVMKWCKSINRDWINLFEAYLVNSNCFLRNMMKIRGRILSNWGRMMLWSTMMQLITFEFQIYRCLIPVA